MTTTTVSPAPRSLDVAATLAAAAEARRRADRAEADLLRLAVRLVDLHPVVDADGVYDDTVAVASWDTAGGASRFVDREAGTGPAPLAGEGTPLVAERAVVELGAAVDVSYRVALALVSDAVELCHRLPRLWALVHDGALQAWKARKVAALTRTVSVQAAAFVDRHAAVAGCRNRLPAHLAGLVHEALAQTDPDTAHGREEAALAHRAVDFDHRGSDSCATTTLVARLDTLDARDLDHTLTRLAARMGRLGDTSPVGVRRAHALGLLAHPHRALALLGEALPTGPLGAPVPSPSRPATLYLHVTAADLAATTSTSTSTSSSTG